jgi:hypothetical protein
MDRDFQNSRETRWNAMISTLMDNPGGIVARLQSNVFFGMVLFGGPVENCPYLVTVQPALNNFGALDQAISRYNRSQVLYTPTALALEAAYSLQPAELDVNFGQHIVILCTDGNPNSCEAAQNQANLSDPPPEFDGPIQQVTAGYNQGMKTFVISLASEGPDYEQHLAQVAEIGNPGTRPFSPSTRDDLVAKMQELIGGAMGCQVTLNGKVTPGQECTGTVVLNNEPLLCNDPNGWHLVDERTIEIDGEACERFMNNPASNLEAGFPCDVFDSEIII